MADPKKTGLDYANDCIKDFKRYFDLIFVRMNDDIRDDNAIFDLALKGSGQADLALDVLKHFGDKIKIYIEKGEIYMVDGLPPGFDIEIIAPGKQLSYKG